jgi:hypothetical protein
MCDPLDLNTTPICPGCHKEHLDHEDEQDAGLCWNCQSEESGAEMPEDPQPETLLTSAQLDQLCGVTHRRKSA